ncbi:Maf family protein [Albirhodobacter sp. R86504]|uniref:Maf family protein n=1 Tax=Albirhodobacter sp. R86504 TaxID=3093848 RepID=UPI0036707547
MHSLILASASEIRAQLLRNAGLQTDVRPARIDEDMIRLSLEAEGASPRDVADALAEMKAQKISLKNPADLVIGADQVLALKGKIFSKPIDKPQACEQLKALSGQIHRLLSAVVVYQDGKPLWRHIGEVRLHMHPLSEPFIAEYVDRNWDSIRWSVGGYKLEEEGVRLFSKIEGDYFSVLGLPLTEFLNWLRARGDLTT